jgi:hypothetical protein
MSIFRQIFGYRNLTPECNVCQKDIMASFQGVCFCYEHIKKMNILDEKTGEYTSREIFELLTDQLEFTMKQYLDYDHPVWLKYKELFNKGFQPVAKEGQK